MDRFTQAVLLAAALAAAAVGCTHPTAAYDNGRTILERSRQRIMDGDQALVAARYDRAAGQYDKAARDLAKAVAYLEQAEQQVEDQIRSKDQASHAADPQQTPAQNETVVIGSRDVAVDRFYVETLRGYREALALAVVMRALALQRLGEAHYRAAARDLMDGDLAYPARQFAAAETLYDGANDAFRNALATFGQTADFVAQRTLHNDRLAEAAPNGTWPLMGHLGTLAEYRRVQTDAYLAAGIKRHAQAHRVAEAYRDRDPGNVPDVEVRPLEALPALVRHGVIPPPIPSTAPGN